MDDSERIKAVLLELRMDAESLALSIGKKTGDTIRNIINRRNRISVKIARAISEKHGIDYVWLLTGAGEMLTKVNFDERKVTNDKDSVYSGSEIKSEPMEKLLLSMIVNKLDELDAEVKQLKKDLGKLEERQATKNIKPSQ